MRFRLFVVTKKGILTLNRNMAVFKQVVNPITGGNHWDIRNDDYDYHQEVANAGFGDMLHDRERNQKYYAALRKVIAKMHAEGRKAHVLDIGTGTGILSMMAVTAGADSVTACESFLPMAHCAEKILSSNGMQNKVKLIKKRSTDLRVGEDAAADMPSRANLLVTEVLDTELIGEGAIGIYNHAHDELLTDDVICVPARATCYAQVAQSSLAAQWNSLKILSDLDGHVLLKPPPDNRECKGEATLHDLQLSQLPLEQIRPLTTPNPVFEFDFSSKRTRPTCRNRNVRMKSIAAGSADLVLYWWDIKMDPEGEILLSCAPFWAHPEWPELSKKKSEGIPLANVVPWRDHWMQAIYYIPKPFELPAPESEFTLSCNHDEYSLWFDAFPLTDSDSLKPVPRHTCICGWHIAYSRSRIGQMNQMRRNKRYLSYLEESINKDSHVLVLGDGCLLGLSAAKLGAASVICHEAHNLSHRFMTSLAQYNDLTNVEFIRKLKYLEAPALSRLTHIFAEPYFFTSILPWDNFYFGTLLEQIKAKHPLPASVQVSPHSACILAVPVEFLDLHKIRTPLTQCEGFDLTQFDEMVDTSMMLAHAKVEAQPLWEYPCRALATPKQIMNITFSNFLENKATRGTFSIEESGSCNGIALWVDWHIDESSDAVVSTGPTQDIQPGAFIKWDMFVRQGVHLISSAKEVQQSQSSICWSAEFKPAEGEINFHFDVNP